MKKSLLYSSLLLLAISFCFAYMKPFSTNLESSSQMWNTANTYFATINPANPTNLGAQLDTAVNTTSMQLSVAALSAGRVNRDTFNFSPLNGTGKMTLVWRLLKCTGTPTVTATPVESLDGISWAQIPGTTVATVSPTSLTVPVVTVFHTGDKLSRYYGMQILGSASSTTSSQCWFYYQKNAAYQLSAN